MELVRGYFTVEGNVVGLTLQEMEGKLGFPPGRLLHGARVLLLQRQPSVGEFVSAGSTWYPNAEGLVGVEQRRVAASDSIPHAWFNQRLVKIVANLPHSPSELPYPRAESPVEQWQLLGSFPAEEVCRLSFHQVYWGDRRL